MLEGFFVSILECFTGSSRFIWDLQVEVPLCIVFEILSVLLGYSSY